MVFRPMGPAVRMAWANGQEFGIPAMIQAHRAGHSVGTCRMSNGWAVGPLGIHGGVGSWPDGPGYWNEWPVGPKHIGHGLIGRNFSDVVAGRHFLWPGTFYLPFPMRIGPNIPTVF